MFVETSSIVAILLEEPERRSLMAKIVAADQKVTSVANAFEAALSIGRETRNYGEAGELVARFLEISKITVVDIPADLYDEMVRAYSLYGRGGGHPASLNFGDCLSYALAKRMNMPLLFKGDDFSQTDVARA